MSEKRSWVETTCPPGWTVRVGGPGMWCAYQRDWLTGNVETRGGDVLWCDTEADANRLAWERWALEVIGPVTWYDDWISSPLVVMARGGLYIAADYEEEAPRWFVEGARSSHVRLSAASTDPVEALARLAALTLAVLGPEVDR